jgi:CRP-like cAMP-binding protein
VSVRDQVTVRVQRTSFNLRSFLLRLAGERAVKTYVRDQMIVRQGDAGSDVFFVLSGKIKLTIVRSEGKAAVLAIIGPGDFFGIRSLAGEPQRGATATALTECSLLRLGKVAMTRALREEPRFVEAFISSLLRTLVRVEESLLDHLFYSSEQRLARLLLVLADPEGKGAPGEITPAISQQMLAEMVGTTRARISVFMNKFRRLGLIEYDGHLVVHGSLQRLLRE